MTEPLTLAERLNALHGWLWACTKDGPETVCSMVDDLKTARANGIPWPGVADDGITMQQHLERLADDGLATRNEPGGSLWRWAEGKAKAAVTRQPGLF